MIRWEEYWKKWIAKNNYQANFLCLSLAAIHRSMNTHWLWTMIKMDLWLFDDIFCCCYIQKEIGCQFNMVSWLVSNLFFFVLHQSIWIDWWFWYTVKNSNESILQRNSLYSSSFKLWLTNLFVFLFFIFWPSLI